MNFIRKAEQLVKKRRYEIKRGIVIMVVCTVNEMSKYSNKTEGGRGTVYDVNPSVITDNKVVT